MSLTFAKNNNELKRIGTMQYIYIFLILNIACVSESYIIRSCNKDHNKRSIYPDQAQSTDDGGKKEGEGSPCKQTSNACSNALGKGNAKSKATNIAQKAAQEAKAANDVQLAAAEAAAVHVKTELAEKALQSARAAEAALAGKQQIMEQLEKEQLEAEAVVTEVTTSLQNTQSNAVAATDAAAEARSQLNNLKQLVQLMTENLTNIENVANGAQMELAEKTQLLEAAKNRVDSLSRQFTEAKKDFETTKKAAYKAACSAVEANQKAQRSGRKRMSEKRLSL